MYINFFLGQEADAFINACLNPDHEGNLPAMIAALYNRKEALIQLLAPFITSKKISHLDQLIHHKNLRGQRLLGLVVHHRRSLLVAHGILVEFEALVHDEDSREIKACFRDTLGSTSGAADTLNLFSRIEKKQGSSLFLSRSLICLKIFVLTFLLRFCFLIFDLYTDIHLLKDYYSQWKNNETDTMVTSSAHSFNVCGGIDDFSFQNGTDGSWEPFRIPPR